MRKKRVRGCLVSFQNKEGMSMRNRIILPLALGFVMMLTTEGLTQQPDLQVQHEGGAWLGEGIINHDGTDQTANRTAEAGHKTVFPASLSWWEPAAIPVGDAPSSVAITPDGAWGLVTNSGNDTVSVVDLAARAEMATIPVGDHPYGVAITPDGTWALVTNRADDTASVVDLATQTEVATIPVGDYPYGVAITPGGAWALVTNRADDNVSVIDLATPTEMATIPVGNAPSGVAITPDGTTALITNWDNDNVSVFDLGTRTQVAIIPVGNKPDGIAITPDGAIALVANYNDGTVSVVNLDTRTETATISVGNAPMGVAITSPGTTAFVANRGDHTVSELDLEACTEAAIHPVEKHPSGVATIPGITTALVTNWGDDTVSVVESAFQTAWIQGSSGTPDRTVQYYEGAAVDPEHEITDQVTSTTGWECVNSILEGPQDFLITVTPSPGASGSYQVLITATWDPDPTRLDAIKAVTTVVYPQPDLWIQQEGDWLGDNIYNNDGTDQTGTCIMVRETTAVHPACLYNDGPGSGTFWVQGPNGNEDWTVQYFAGTVPDPKQEITDQVTSLTGWECVQTSLEEPQYFLITVTLGPGASQSYEVLVTATSDQDPAFSDAIKAVTFNAGADTIYVDAGNAGDPEEDGSSAHPYDTIQEGIDAAAVFGCIVQVAAGTYRENLVWEDKSLILQGAGAGLSIVDGDVDEDGEGDGSCLRLHNVPHIAQITGFSFQHGSGYYSEDPERYYYGGGLYLFYSHPEIINNEISANLAEVGGGLYLYASAAKVRDNEISGNSADFGGGLLLYASEDEVSHNTISGNSARNFGGGLYLASSSPVSHNTICDNSAYKGGGLYLNYSSPLVSHNTICDNSAKNKGGGLRLWHSGATVINNFVVNNTAHERGGGIALRDSRATFTNNTIVGNHRSGVVANPGHPGPPRITNCILWGNSPGKDLDNASATYSNIGTGEKVGQGNISEDPQFVGSGDYHLQPTSPCINRGNNEAPNLPATDIDDHPRLLHGVVDMGADEVPNPEDLAPRSPDLCIQQGSTWLGRGVCNTDGTDQTASVHR